MQPKLCFKTKKRNFPQKHEAEKALYALWRKKKPGRKYPIRVYKCEHCNNWHHTKNPR